MSRKWPVYAVLVVCAVLVASGAFRVVRGEDEHQLGAYSRVVVVGVPGLDWSDVTPDATPRLYALAEVSERGLLTSRGASTFACPADGWVTLGAGNRAVSGSTHDCRAQDAQPTVDAEQIHAANDAESFGADPGLLGRQVSCVRTYGRDAGLAAVDAGDVRPSRLEGLRTPAQWETSWSDCPLALVAGPSLRAGAGEHALRRVDNLVGTVSRASAQDDDTLLLVVGVSDLLGAPPSLHVAIASGRSVEGGSAQGHGGDLISASTGRARYVQLIDVAPTALAALGVDRPSGMVGRPMAATPTDDDPRAAIERLVADEQAANARYASAVWLVWMWVVVTALYLLVGGALAASSRRQRWQRPLSAAGICVASIPAATGLANLVPWWEATWSGLVWGLALAGSVAALTAVALAGPWRQRRFGPAVAVAAAGFGVFALDVVTGSHLQLNGLLGNSPIGAGRFTGFGNMPFAVYAAGGLICLAAAMHREEPQTSRWLAVVGGGTLVLLDGMPGLGADVGGVLALVPAVVLLTTVAVGARVSVSRVVAALAAGAAVVVVLAIVDYQRPSNEQTHLGRFVGQVLDGTAGEIVGRKASANLHMLVDSPVAVLTPALLVALGWLFRGPDAPGRRLLAGSGPSLQAAMVGVGVVAVVGSLLNDSGIAVLAAASASTVPLMIAGAATMPAPRGTDATELLGSRLPAGVPGHTGAAARSDAPHMAAGRSRDRLG